MPRLSKIGAAALGAFGWTGLSTVSASYLVVAGGGGGATGVGGSANGGGGGAGGLLTGTTSLSLASSYTVTVGSGGATNANGSNSQFGTLTASVGGGSGGYNTGNGQTGGSGGGASSYTSSTAGAATSGQGFAGGTQVINTGTGGGGGAGAVGGNAATVNGGNGGAGSEWPTSSGTYYAGGGGGSTNIGGSAGTGGSGGGGAGGVGVLGTAGTANLGGGGGGGAASAVGGQGGSGVVIIRYLGAQQFGGGVVTSSGGYTIHTFNTSGTLAPLSSVTVNNYLIVAGGGGAGGQETTAGGGGWSGGGGGAGGMLTGSGITIDTNSTYLVTVGSGGAGGTSSASPTDGTSGSSSAFSMVTTTAVGGGGGGKGGGNVSGAAGLSGGSGGGGGSGFTGAGAAGGAGTSGQGSAGGTCPANSTGGGGGGKGGAGGVPTRGTGSVSSISGASVTYATGGLGQYLAGNTAGTANTGNGGDNSTTINTNSLAGGSGVVIISYAGATQLMAGGTVTISGGNVIHTFNSSGYLAPLKLVNNSLRTRSSASAYLNRTPPVASNRRTWTWSAWVKRGVLSSSDSTLFNAGTTGIGTNDTGFFGIRFTSGDTLDITTGLTDLRNTTQVFRDPAAWYHIVVAVDTTQATAANRVNVYVNGTQVTAFGTSNNPSPNLDTAVNNTNVHEIARTSWSGTTYFDGYQTEVNFIDGQQLTPNSFGTFNSYGVWQPITYGGSYGTNGFYLPFTNTNSTTTLGYDFSPQGNNWTPNNFSLARSSYTSYTSGSGTYTVPTGVTSIQYLVVAGGGGGYSGGGGAGGLLQGTMTVTSGQTIAYSVGGGGTGGNYGSGIPATNGTDTTFGALTAIGGGAGTSAGNNGNTGGSGSGGAGSGSGTTTGGAGTSGQGFAGGGNVGFIASPYPSGGGGGAGATGSNAASSSTSGAGGAGLAWVNGTTYAGGGGGGTFSSGNPAGAGGSGGGGGGGSTGNGTAGTPNTGGGGGGSPSSYIGGAGGSGIIIIGTGSASTYDSMTDVPTLTSATVANYCVLNPLSVLNSSTTADGNLKGTLPAASVSTDIYGTMSSGTTGKFYWETTYVSRSGNSAFAIGLVKTLSSGYPDTTSTGGVGYYSVNGAVYVDGSSAATYATFTTSDVIGIALDLTNSQVSFYKQTSGTGSFALQGTVSIASGNSWTPSWNNGTSSGNQVYTANFGQQPFNNSSPPSGFVALNTYNL
jgi:hypothetical protein